MGRRANPSSAAEQKAQTRKKVAAFRQRQEQYEVPTVDPPKLLRPYPTGDLLYQLSPSQENGRRQSNDSLYNTSENGDSQPATPTSEYPVQTAQLRRSPRKHAATTNIPLRTRTNPPDNYSVKSATQAQAILSTEANQTIPSIDRSILPAGNIDASITNPSKPPTQGLILSADNIAASVYTICDIRAQNIIYDDIGSNTQASPIKASVFSPDLEPINDDPPFDDKSNNNIFLSDQLDSTTSADKNILASHTSSPESIADPDVVTPQPLINTTIRKSLNLVYSYKPRLPFLNDQIHADIYFSKQALINIPEATTIRPSISCLSVGVISVIA